MTPPTKPSQQAAEKIRNHLDNFRNNPLTIALLATLIAETTRCDEMEETEKHLRELCKIGVEIGGYTLEHGHDSPEAEFLWKLMECAEFLARLSPK